MGKESAPGASGAATGSEGDGGQSGAGKSSEGAEGAKKPEGKGDQQSGNTGGSEGEPKNGSFDDSKVDESTLKYIKELRGESAKYRTKAKNLESQVGENAKTLTKLKQVFGLEQEDPTTEDFEKVAGENGQLNFRNAILEAAVEQGIGKDGLGYFQYLVTEKTSSLEEGEELSEEDLTEIAAQVQKVSGGGSSSTSVDSKTKDGNDGKKPGEGADTVGIDEFSVMNTTERTQLYTDNPDLYDKLTKEARRKGRFINVK